MKKSILVASTVAFSLAASAQQMTVKEIISKLKSPKTIEQIATTLESNPFADLIDKANEDLTFEFNSVTKLTIRSKSDFEYVKVNHTKLPKNARATLEIFGYGIKATKKGGVFVIESLTEN